MLTPNTIPKSKIALLFMIDFSPKKQRHASELDLILTRKRASVPLSETGTIKKLVSLKLGFARSQFKADRR
jgi:hypothetical protein